MDFKEIALEVVQIAKAAGDAILEVYQGDEDFGVEAKSDDSPLTKADRAANAVICAGLEKMAVQFPIISEENKLVDYSIRKDYDYFWLVDPLDGTKEFIKRNGEFTVNIALVKGGKPIMGIVYAPVLEEMYWAAEGEGAFLQKDGKETKLEVPTYTMKDKGLNIVCSRSHMNEETKQFVEALNSPNLVSKGSSLKFLLLAKGEAHIYPRIAPTMEWDTAAAQAVVEQAGGKVMHYETKAPLNYNKEVLLNPYFVVHGNVQ